MAPAARRQRQGDAVLGLHEDDGERQAVHAEVRGLPAAQTLLRPGTQPEPTVQGRPVMNELLIWLRFQCCRVTILPD